MNTLEQIEQISQEFKVLNLNSDFLDLGIVRLDVLLSPLLIIYSIAMRLQVAKSDMQTTIRTGCLTCKKRSSTHQNRHFTQHHLYHLYKGCPGLVKTTHEGPWTGVRIYHIGVLAWANCTIMPGPDIHY